MKKNQTTKSWGIITFIILTLFTAKTVNAQEITLNYSPILANAILEKAKENGDFTKTYAGDLSGKDLNDIAISTSIIFSSDPKDAKLFFKKGMKAFVKAGKMSKIEYKKFIKFTNSFFDGKKLGVVYQNLIDLKSVGNSDVINLLTSNVNTSTTYSSINITEEQGREIMGVIGGVIAVGAAAVFVGPLKILLSGTVDEIYKIGVKIGEGIYDLIINIAAIFKKDGKGALNKIANALGCAAEDLAEIGEDVGKAIVKAVEDGVNSLGKAWKFVKSKIGGKKKETSSFMLGRNGEPDYNPW